LTTKRKRSSQDWLDLVDRAKTDPDAYDELLVASLALLRPYAYRFTKVMGHRYDAEDLLHDAAIPFAGWLERYDNGSSHWTTWIATKFSYFCRDHARRPENNPVCDHQARNGRTVKSVSINCHYEWNKSSHYRDNLKAREWDLPATYDEGDWIDGFNELLRGQDDVDRLILIGYYRDGLTMKEIGQSVGLSESRVSQRHAEALERARAMLEAQQ